MNAQTRWIILQSSYDIFRKASFLFLDYRDRQRLWSTATAVFFGAIAIELFEIRAITAKMIVPALEFHNSVTAPAYVYFHFIASLFLFRVYKLMVPQIGQHNAAGLDKA